VPTLSEAVNVGLLVTLMAVFVAGLAAVLGIWMERDKKKPPRYAWALSALIVLATFVKREQDALKEDMARLLSTMDKLAHESDDPALKELVKSELTAQSRSNPEVIDKVAQRVSDEGRDPGEVLGRNLDAAEAEKVARKSKVKPKETENTGDKPKPKPEDAKQGAAAPTAPVEVKRPVVTAGPPAAAAAKGVPIDPAMAARMGAAAGQQPAAAGTPAAPVPAPVSVGVAAPGKPDAKAAAAAEARRKAAPGKRGPGPVAGGRKPAPKKPGK
jgi:hypothetical protein